ncbi:MAG: hypothetical protein ABL879_05565 [Devosia sp.]
MEFQRPQLGEIVILRCGDASLAIAPACGARVLSFAAGGRDVLRPAGERALQKLAPYDFAAFPLMPYSGPIFGGGFRHGATFYPLERNLSAEGDAVHGEAWLRSWTIVEQGSDRLRLRLDYEPVEGAFPFAWHGELTYRLSPSALIVDMEIRNASIHSMPAGLGFHPYFVREPQTRLSFAHGDVWPPDSPEAMLVPPMPIEGLDFNMGRDLAGLVADRCFEDWARTATLDYAGGRKVTLTASVAFGKLQLYVPWYDDYVCVEPVTNTNDGFNRARAAVRNHGVVILGHGQSLSGSLSISVGGSDV